MAGPNHRDLPATDPVSPNLARSYAAFLGDPSWAFPADLRFTEEFLQAEPLARDLSRENRVFAGDAVRWVAGRGVRQYLDLGAGLPVSVFPDIHVIAREVVPDVRVAYVDNDPVVFEGLAGSVADVDGVTALLADLRDPAQILRHAQSAGFDLTAPVCVLFCGVLHFVPADQARTIVRRYVDLIPPGSYVVASIGRADGELGGRLPKAFRAGQSFNHGRDEVAIWFTGLDLVPPGLTDARAWQPGQPAAEIPARHGGEVWVGVGCKPGGAASWDPGGPRAEPSRPVLAVPAATPLANWAEADRVLGLLGGKWPRIVLRYLPTEPPGARPSKLLDQINTARADNQGSLSLKILLECLRRMATQGLAERTVAHGTGARRATCYRLTANGRDALAVLRGMAGAAAGPGSWLPRASDVPVIDISKPSIARVYDYLLGGKDNFTADRELAGQLLRLFPLDMIAQENRAFLDRAVSYVAARGISQFIDVGAGLPTSPAVHEIARGHNPDARVVYLDNDPMVTVHASALLGGDGVAAIAGDMAEPEAILAAPALTTLIDLSQPTCMIMAMVLHFVDPDQAARIVGGFTRALAPGSYLIISIGTSLNPGLTDRLPGIFTAGTLHQHTREQVISYFAGFDIIDPGVTDARYWPGGPHGAADDRAVTGIAGVGRKVTPS